MDLFNSPFRSPLDAVSLKREAAINSRVSPWLTPIVYPIGNRILIPFYFGKVDITGQENLPLDGPVILAPTHRSRWDALLVPHAVGRTVTGRDIRFMVTADEMKGIQGWFIRRLGGFPVNPRQPGISSLRFGVELLRQGEMLVIFPEGGIFQEKQVQPLKPGLARLAIQAENSQPGLGVRVVPIYIEYSEPYPQLGDSVSMRIGSPLLVADYNRGSAKDAARRLTADLTQSIRRLGACEMPELSLATAHAQDSPA